MKRFWVLILLAQPLWGTCTNAGALAVLAPGARWSMTNDDLDTLRWMDPVIPRPVLSAILAQVAACQAQAAAAAAQWQQDLVTINKANKNPLEAAIIDVLKQKGLLQ